MRTSSLIQFYTIGHEKDFKTYVLNKRKKKNKPNKYYTIPYVYRSLCYLIEIKIRKTHLFIFGLNQNGFYILLYQSIWCYIFKLQRIQPEDQITLRTWCSLLSFHPNRYQTKINHKNPHHCEKTETDFVLNLYKLNPTILYKISKLIA